jgi:uncharacterized protein (UPF0335 family)
VTGASADIHGVDYSQETFRGELRAMVEYIEREAQERQHLNY